MKRLVTIFNTLLVALLSSSFAVADDYSPAGKPQEKVSEEGQEDSTPYECYALMQRFDCKDG